MRRYKITMLAVVILPLMIFGEVRAQMAGQVETPISTRVVTLGADLTPAQRDTMMRVFGLSTEQATQAGIPILTVTNAEEHTMLGGTVPPETIGSRAISSALVETLAAGKGITVERYNITYVTDAMYGNALVTGGVRDAHVVVAAPTNVSGTAALTGVFKAFERATGKVLSSQAKETAGQELVTTGQIGEQIGNKDKASELVARVKEEVAGKNLRDPAQIRQIVVKVAADLNVELTTEQVNKVTDVAAKVGRLNVTATDFRQQVQGLRQQITNLTPSTDTRNLLQKLFDFLARLFSQFFSTVVGLASRLWE